MHSERIYQKLHGRIAGITVLLLVLFADGVVASEVNLRKHGNVYGVPVEINGVLTLEFLIDSGASEVQLPADVVITLIRSGTISDRDFLGEHQYTLADGSQLKSLRFIIRQLRIGSIRFRDVPASIATVSAPLLLGQSVLSRLNSWALDNKRQVLILGEPKDAIADDACAESYLDGQQIRALFSGKTVKGIRERSRNKAVWCEFLENSGDSQFVSHERNRYHGVWEVDKDQICFSYGTRAEKDCKYILKIERCRDRSGYYIAKGKVGGEITSRILDVREGDQLSLCSK